MHTRTHTHTHMHAHTQFHRECVDPWLRAGHMVCPVDGSTVCNQQPPRAKEKERRERSDVKGRGGVGALTLSGLSIGLPLLLE